ncbi:MAG: hypothetical protein MUP44_06395 [Anaerolineales bacterium]|nr:hypothetical protein [Anaerolineales bacterium]
MENNEGHNGDDTGNLPDVDSGLEPDRVVSSVDQALEICETLEQSAEGIIKNQARITAKLNGEPPRDPKKLKSKAKGYKTNISTGALATECNRVPTRLFMPIKTARYLTAASLPADTVNGPQKTEKFREIITDTIRSWPRWNFFVRGFAREVGVFGFAFPTFFDEWDWRPSIIRGDKGFVPAGTEILEEPEFYEVIYEYKPHELIALAKQAKEAGITTWKIPAIVAAVNDASAPGSNDTNIQARTFEELTRQANVGYSYTKGVKVIKTKHLFAKEHSGKVSHWILYSEGKNESQDGDTEDDSIYTKTDKRLLYEKLDAYEHSMWEVVIPTVFDYGDGTIHGSWGAGQILYDMAHQVEVIRNDSIDALRNSGKVKVQVPDPKDVNSVKLVYNDSHIIVTGAQFAGNTAALPSDISSFGALEDRISRWSQEKVGSYLPPIPSQPSDIKAAQVNAAIAQEAEIKEANGENWLSQFAWLIFSMTRRLCNPLSSDPISKATLERLLREGLTSEEILILRDQAPIKNVMEFTPYKTAQVAQFAASKAGNPLYNQRNIEVAQVQAAAGDRFVESFLLPDGDTATIDGARRAQMEENAAMALGQDVPVLPSDLHWYHMQEMKASLEQVIGTANFPLAKLGLGHYAKHYDAGVQTKTLPKDQINNEKSYIAKLAKIIENAEKAAAQATARITGQPPQQPGQPGANAPVQPDPGQPQVAPPPVTQPILPAPDTPQAAGQVLATDPNV